MQTEDRLDQRRHARGRSGATHSTVGALQYLQGLRVAHVLDDGIDRIAVAHGVVEALQHDRRRPFAHRAAFGAGREQGTHVAGQIDGPGQARVEFAALERPHGCGHGP